MPFKNEPLIFTWHGRLETAEEEKTCLGFEWRKRIVLGEILRFLWKAGSIVLAFLPDAMFPTPMTGSRTTLN